MNAPFPIRIDEPKGDELFIGLVGPLGTDLEAATAALESALAAVHYESVPIKMSDAVRELPGPWRTNVTGDTPEDERIDSLMTACDRMRTAMKSGAAVAHCALVRIRAHRAKNGDANTPLPRTAYVLRSLKHPDEVALLRQVYGARFVLVSFYEPKPSRIENLRRRIERSHGGGSGNWEERAVYLVERDEHDSNDALGQYVGDTFPQADVFARADDTQGSLETDVRRFVRVCFGDPFTSPTPDESMMFQARASALRSADLSRQVGAVIATERAETVASGCNEVPRPGGGIYFTGDDPDRRDFRLGRDS